MSEKIFSAKSVVQIFLLHNYCPQTNYVATGQFVLGNSIGGNANVNAGNVTINPDSKIGGDLDYTSQKQAQISQEATISGKLTHHPVPTSLPESRKPLNPTPFLAGASLAFSLISFVAALIIGLLLIRFFPQSVKLTSQMVTEHLFLSLGVGFLVLVIFPVLFIALLVTVVGIPIAFTLLAIFLIIMYLAKIFISLALGAKIVDLMGNKKTSLWLVFLAGLVVYYVISWIPFFGGLLAFLATLVGLGAIVMEKKNLYNTLRAKNLL